MNKNQKVVVWIVIVVMVAMVVYPPWVTLSGSHRYGFILDMFGPWDFDVFKFFIQGVGVLIVGGLWFFLIGDKGNK